MDLDKLPSGMKMESPTDLMKKSRESDRNEDGGLG